MQKARRALAQIAGRFLFIGISVQIVLGICWMIRAFGIFPESGEQSVFIIPASRILHGVPYCHAKRRYATHTHDLPPDTLFPGQCAEQCRNTPQQEPHTAVFQQEIGQLQCSGHHQIHISGRKRIIPPAVQQQLQHHGRHDISSHVPCDLMYIIGKISLEMINSILTEQLLCAADAKCLFRLFLQIRRHRSRIPPGLLYFLPAVQTAQFLRPGVVFSFHPHMGPGKSAHHCRTHRILRLTITAGRLPQRYRRE
jgi:hypothetical protein